MGRRNRPRVAVGSMTGSGRWDVPQKGGHIVAKRIIVACGSGVATSTAVVAKLKDLLDSHGFADAYTVEQCAIADAVGKSQDADLLIATTVKPDGIGCDFISGIPFLTGMGKSQTEQQILDFMND